MKAKSSKISIFIIGLILTLVSANLHWSGENYKGIIESDAKGYYAYLPAVFIYHDLNFGFFDEFEKGRYYDVNRFFDYRINHDSNIINKCYCGVSVAQLPFFLTGHILSKITNNPDDGFSKLYCILINIAGIFYCLIGLVFLNKILKDYITKDIFRSFILIATIFGTNIFYYVIGEPGMSHIYSFAFFTLFYFYLRKYFKHFDSRLIVLLAALLGIITLIRPVNLLILLTIPFAATDYKNLTNGINKLLSKPLIFTISFILFLCIIAIQFIIYKIQTGHFFIYSYPDEGFYFLNPQLFNILFSYKKGLFLYSPLLFISLAGGFFLYRKNRYQFYTLFISLFLITYVLSSWWNWWYGGSFSSRVYVEYIPLFSILLAMALEGIINKPLKKAYITLIVILVIVCQIQTYQYRYYFIHWEDMTKEKYWNVFLRVDKLIEKGSNKEQNFKDQNDGN